MKKFLSILCCLSLVSLVAAQEVPVETAVPEVEEISTEEVIAPVVNAEENKNPVEEKTEEPAVSDIDTMIQQKLAEYAGMVLEYQSVLSKNNEAVNLVKLIENKKSDILAVRQLILDQTSAYNAQIDEKLAADKKEILEAPVLLAESNGMGELSDAARFRRQNKVVELEKEAAANKKAYLEKIQSELGSSEKKELSLLASYYKDLESKTFTETSYSENFTITFGDFNVDDGCWTMSYKCKMFGLDNVLDTTVKLPYQDITGKKYIGIEKMNDEEFRDFQKDLAVYTSAFKEIPQIFYAKMNFQVYRWKQASEYRIVPKNLEVSFIANKNKVIAKQESKLTPHIFVMNPAQEVRTKAEISEDAVNATKIIAKEAKESETEADRLYREYTSNFENDRYANSKEPVIQKGRGAFILSGNYMFAGSEFKDMFTNFDSEQLIPDLVNIEIDFPYSNFGYWGLSAGLCLPVAPGTIDFQFGTDLGFNFMITNSIRPYIQATGAADTKYNGILEAGAGVDFIFAKRILLNIGYNYRWSYDFNNLLNPNVDTSSMTEEERNSIPLSTSHKFTIGVGVAW